MKRPRVYAQEVLLVLVVLVTACAAPKAEPCATTAPLSCPNTAALQTGLTPISSSTMRSAEVSPMSSELGVEKTLETTTGIAPTLQSTEASTGDNTPQLSLLDELKSHEGDDGFVTSVAFSPNGDILAVGNMKGVVKLYNIVTGDLLAELDPKLGRINRVAFSPDGKLIAAGGADYESEPAVFGVRIWDMATQEEVLFLNDLGESVNAIAFSPNGATLATGDGNPWGGPGTAKVWDVATGKLLSKFELTSGPNLGGEWTVLDVAFNPEGTLLGTVSQNGQVFFWDVEKESASNRLMGVDGLGPGVAFSVDGNMLATRAPKGYISLWKMATGKRFNVVPVDELVERISLSHDGKLLAAALFQTVKVWDMRTAELIGQAECGDYPAIAFSHDGTVLAIAKMNGVISLLEVPDQQ